MARELFPISQEKIWTLLPCLLNCTFNFITYSYARNRPRWKMKSVSIHCKSIKILYFAMKTCWTEMTDQPYTRENTALSFNLWHRSTHSFKFCYILKRRNVTKISEVTSKMISFEDFSCYIDKIQKTGNCCSVRIFFTECFF